MNEKKSFKVAVIGGGPSGLMTAEQLAKTGVSVTVYDRMPSLGRKFLMAGRGGLNLTHSEDFSHFVTRYGAAQKKLQPALERFAPDAVRAWCEELGQETFVGSSGRIFPKAMKASPLLRAWLRRLDALGVQFALRHDWQGWDGDGQLVFTQADQKTVPVKPDATILALGGASWPRLGADGGWASILAKQKIDVAPLRPSNCGFAFAWSSIFRSRFAGQPLKSIALSYGSHMIRGEAMITAAGIEGGAVYALSSVLRDAIENKGIATLSIDLRPWLSVDELTKKFATPRGGQSLSTYLRKAIGLSPIAIGLLQEVIHAKSLAFDAPLAMAQLIKAIPLPLKTSFSIERAISTAGGIKLDEIDDHFMLINKPGVFAAGEMLDWEAPTGGYLLQGCFSTAVAVSDGVLRWLQK